MHVPLLSLFEVSLWACIATALPVNHTDDQVGALIDAGTFRKPSANVRPRYRYWIPDASINTTLLADDILQLARRGAGGIEFLPYFDYGGRVGRGPSTDWNIYGFGTPKYRDVLKAALQTHEDLGLIMDYSMGPQSGQGVPAAPDEPGLAYNLDYYNVSLSGGEAFTATLPGWGSGELVSAVAFATTNVTNVFTTMSDFSLIGQSQSTDLFSSSLHTIASSSLTDLTAQVLNNGTLSVTVPNVEGAVEHYIMAGYYRRSYERACIASSSEPQNILQNGSFAVDHFSPVGAKLTTDFLEKYVFEDGILDLIKRVGNYIWEDSVEIVSMVYWTPDLASAFESQHGYRIEKYLPLLAGRNGDVHATQSIGPHWFRLDTEDEGSGVIGDWRQTMTVLLATYYDHLVNWTHSYLDLQFSGQIGYNLPTDMLSNVAIVNAPEAESLTFSNNIDSFRQYVGPASLAGKRVISTEAGSDWLETYTQTWTDLLRDAKRAFVTGVNQVVLHGAPYSHSYPNTTWPGFTSFSYSFAAHHSRHQPAWDVGYAEAGEYLARTQYILQRGVQKVDLVFWDKRTAELPYPETLYWPKDLTAAGYSYTYLSPDNFASPKAFVLDGVLAPDAQAFRALIVRANDTLTVEGINALSEFAQAGLPIIISGGVPGNPELSRQPPYSRKYVSGQVPAAWNTNNITRIQAARATLQSTLALPNVYQVPYECLAQSITDIGIRPRIKINATEPGTWFTHWREDDDGDIYVFVYNDGNSSKGSISFETILTPTVLDAWNGNEVPVVAYASDSTQTTVDFALGFTETIIVRFSEPASREKPHIVSAPAGALLNSYAIDTSQIAARLTASDNLGKSIMLSNGTSVEIPLSIPAGITLTNWSLTIEQWNPPEDLFDVETVANKSNVTFSLAGPQLEPWYRIADSLTNVSGIGHYSSRFYWPPPSRVGSLDYGKNSSANDSAGAEKTNGAVLALPRITHGITILLNGEAIPPVDITHPIADISSYLVHGENVLSVSVASTLYNVLAPIWDRLRTGTSTPDPSTLEVFEAYGFGGVQAYGIIGEVKVVPYVTIAM